MHTKPGAGDVPQSGPRQRKKRSRFTSSASVNELQPPIPSDETSHLQNNECNPTTIATISAVSALRARITERKAAANNNAPGLYTNPNDLRTGKTQRNAVLLKKAADSKSTPPGIPHAKRRRTSRFGQAEPQTLTGTAPIIPEQKTADAEASATSYVSHVTPSSIQSVVGESRISAVEKNIVKPASTQLSSTHFKPRDPRENTTFDLTAIPIAPPKTLSINKKAEKKQKLATVLKVSEKDLLDTNPQSNPYFDPTLQKPTRAPRTLQKPFTLVEQGVITDRAQQQREKAAVNSKRALFTASLTSDVAQTSEIPILPPHAEDLTLSVPSKVPVAEWWDLPFIEQPGDNQNAIPLGEESLVSRSEAMTNINEFRIREERITHYIHHPPPIEPAKQKKTDTVIPLMLTKKETKKLRRQRRLEAQKEKQEMIAAGLLPQPPPKVKLSNMMRVLATETSLDPTKVEAEVRAQVEARRQKHEADNKARQKSGEERREKAREKRETDKATGLYAAVFRIAGSTNAGHRFKVDRNAKQLGLTGVMVLFSGCNVVVVEGGAKALRKYKILVLRRMDWSSNTQKENSNVDGIVTKEEDTLETADGQITDKNDKKPQKTKCVLVWEGVISSASFKSFQLMPLRNESACRKMFTEHHVEHYWDLCLQASPLGNEKLGVANLQ